MVDVFRRNAVLPAVLADKGYVSFQSGKWWEGRPQDSGFTAAGYVGGQQPRWAAGTNALGTRMR